MKLSEIEQCVGILLKMAKARGVEEVNASDDGYWTIVSPEWRDIYVKEEPTPGIGSFTDDEEELRRLLESPARASAVDLERLSHLLRLLSDRLSQ